jgi:DNA-binding response OmpR family regulator
LYRATLASQGWDVELVQDGESAWSRAKSSLPDVLLLNSLRDLSRTSFLERLRGNESTRNIVVIVLANTQQDDELGEGTDFGVAARLIKNWITRDKLPEIVRSLVDRRVAPTTSPGGP